MTACHRETRRSFSAATLVASLLAAACASDRPASPTSPDANSKDAAGDGARRDDRQPESGGDGADASQGHDGGPAREPGGSGFQTVPPRRIDGGLKCRLGAAPAHQIAIDAGGNIYVVMACDAEPRDLDPAPLPDPDGLPALPPDPNEWRAYVVISHDGGQTFTRPQPVGRKGYQVQVAAGPVGAAWVATADGAAGLTLTRTEDAGATWSQPERLASRGKDSLFLAGRGKQFVITAETGAGTRFWSSVDGGATLRTAKPVDFSGVQALGIDARRVVWVASGDARVTLRRSDDGGITFVAPGTRIETAETVWTSIFGADAYFGQFGQSLVRVALDDLRQVVRIPLPPVDPNVTPSLRFIPCPGGSVAQTEAGSAGGTSLTWRHSTGLGRTHVLDGVFDPGGVAVADDAVALAYTKLEGNQIFFTLQTDD
jgi:hypothetical protein